MNNQILVPIERKEGVTIYGVMNEATKRLGPFEVHSEVLGNNGSVYHSYSDAQNRMNALIGVQKKF